MNLVNSKIAITTAAEILSTHFGIHGTVHVLPGEIDLNYRINIDGVSRYILKISNQAEDQMNLDFQQALLQYASKNTNQLTIPSILENLDGEYLTKFVDAQGQTRFVRLLSWVAGRVWATVNPQLDKLRLSLGNQCGLLTRSLTGFDHEFAHREFEWDVANGLWIKQYLHLFDPGEKEILKHFIGEFEKNQGSYNNLRKAVVHNDANDYNILVSEELVNPKVIALIDYGDAIYTQVINDLAICCSYTITNHNDPLEASLAIVKGYHTEFPLQEEELAHLYSSIAMRLAITVTKSAINKIENPENTYLLISEKPAWDLLKKWVTINSEFAYYSFRSVCGFSPHPTEQRFLDWSAQQKLKLTDLFPTQGNDEVCHLDLSVSSPWIGHQKEFNNLDLFQFKIDQLQKENPTVILAGGYLEPRPIYTSTAYDKIGNSGSENRCVHIGVDFWLPAGTSVSALFDSEVVMAVNDHGEKEYGGLIVLKHSEDGLDFYSLYGHLNVASVLKYKKGDRIKKGTSFAELGDYPENGNWAPHLHFQLMLSILDFEVDFPGVTYLKQIEIWKSLCPDPNNLFKLEPLRSKNVLSNDALIDYRNSHLGKGLSLQYKYPIKMVRGNAQYLIDQFGNSYLDTVNNVAHVGHENFEVVKAGQTQMAMINTNSRYLHENINELAKSLLETLPKEISVLHFVNSGSEANELAMRMAKTQTGELDIIASEVGYHGNSNLCIDISSYKFDGAGGKGAPPHTHIFPLPDVFRGKHKGIDAAEKYADEVQKQLDIVHAENRGIAAFIIEPIISCGGQIELPEGFLQKAYKKVRSAGGLCISDEVQTGCGRMGRTFWGFQLHDVIPDIVTIGKPLGNGHPVAAVACTPAVAHAFANGMEYFNTFGGNPVSCAIAHEVLATVKRDKLQENALIVGDYLKEELIKLAKKFPILGDIRGQGLFLGIELVDSQMNPLPEHTAYLADRMKNHQILMSIDGPDHNVLKIKPPLVFTKDNATTLLNYIEKIIAEDFMQSYTKII